jgi:hypothetical protein
MEKGNTMKKRRPNFDRAWHAFIAVRLPVKAVGEKIGGNVKKNIDLDPKQGGFTNACPIRMSYVLNSTGFLIPRAASYKSVSGADGHQYLYRVPDMMAYLEHVFASRTRQ